MRKALQQRGLQRPTVREITTEIALEPAENSVVNSGAITSDDTHTSSTSGNLHVSKNGSEQPPPPMLADATPTAPKRSSQKCGTRCTIVLAVALIACIIALAALLPYRGGSSSSQGFQMPLAPDASFYGSPPLSMGLPSKDTELTFFAHGSCANQRKPQRFWRTIMDAAAQPHLPHDYGSLPPQLVIFNGDIVYGDCESTTHCSKLPFAWRNLSRQAAWQEAGATLPMIGLLDDHDYGANDAHAGMTKFDIWKNFAKEIFLERFGVPADDERRSRNGLYRWWQFGPAGRRTQIIALDTRWFRSPFLPTACHGCEGMERYVEYNTSGSLQQTMLGEEQWAWLEGVLSQPADLRIVVSTVQVLAKGHGWERWGLIPTEVDRLVRLIGSTGARGVVLLSGDRHTGGLYRLPRAGTGDPGEVTPPYDLFEMTSSSFTHAYRTKHDETSSRRIGSLLHMNQFGTIAVDWGARTVKLDLRLSDNCGESKLGGYEDSTLCYGAGNGTAGRVVKNVTISLDALVP